MSGFESDRPVGYDDKHRKYPYIHPEDLKPSEPLAIDADSVEDFIEHFEHHDEHIKTHPHHHGSDPSPESRPAGDLSDDARGRESEPAE